jgi:ABC-type transport system involved in cytochrome bd biosynthesis fused ATPase/permease subunit
MVAHILKNTERSDQIFLVDKGRVFDQGTYGELIVKNETCQKNGYSIKEIFDDDGAKLKI